MCQLLLLVKPMALISEKEELFASTGLEHEQLMDLKLKLVFQIA